MMDVLAFKPDPAPDGVDESNDGSAQGGLATAAFADQPQRLGFGNVQADAVDRLGNKSRGAEPAFNRIMDLEIAYLEEFHGRL
jgi:hypothetical protein